MTRFMYDSVSPGNIPAGATMVAGYADGLYANIPDMKARFPHATVVSIAVRWTTRAQVMDVENGDATPAQAVAWCTQTMAATSNHELTVYCDTSTWPAVRAAFKSAGVTEPNYWVAQYDNDPTVPAGAIAKQYQGDTNGYDRSVVADYWPGVDPKPASTETYPGANTSHWYNAGSNAGVQMQVNTIVWHSTETLALPDYSGGSIAPTLTAVPNWAAQRLDWWQHFPFDTSARALVHDKTQIGTNTLKCAQVEVVGTCDPATHAAWTKSGIAHLYMPDLPDWALRDLHAFARWAHDVHAVPLTSGLRWLPYPQSYGANGVRMDTAAWSAWRGHCGHQHVPENDHGDPGAFPILAVLDPKPAPSAPSYLVTEDDDMTPFAIPPSVDMDIPVEPAGTAQAPQGGARNAGVWIGLAPQGADGKVSVTYHQGGKWAKPTDHTATVAGGKLVLALPTDGSVDKVRVRSAVPLLAYVTGRKVA
ncbi:hypothetical protein [Streptomyces roseochromogenus]|uniref:Uncharacterized protein n=1 Tax=Streptomyces roseochromogenus subsp. oscitans DS 12.976 TaxID=1352936 RepID=V6JWU6_STRRC|nr:hypothetical protein [Streptomyces roseochromogenus]EST24400.1 hypothetical protein M878_30780 [Streptomyces roseochromogenus subsp. oscitans DS 12.976]